MLHAAMSKYDKLTRFLQRQRTAEVSLSFAEIERIIGGLLPKASQTEDWWTEAAETPQALAFQASGFQVEASPRLETVLFHRHDDERPG